MGFILWFYRSFNFRLKSWGYKSLLHTRGLIHFGLWDNPGYLYQREKAIFEAWMKERGIEDIYFYPKAGAADYKLMILLSNIVEGINEINGVEFGSGQSTKIVAKLISPNGNWQAFENDTFWHKCVQEEVIQDNVNIHLSPIVSTTLAGKPSAWYSIDRASLHQGINCILLDGPYGAKTFSRGGICEFISGCIENRLLADDFVILVDDLQRIGELQSFIALLQVFKKHNQNVHHVIFHGFKKIGVIYTKKFEWIKFQL